MVCDDRKVEELRSEYSPKWACDKFQNSGGTKNFTSSELNGHWAGGNESRHAPWGYIDEGLATGLQEARDAYGEAILVTSGYRCPNGNSSIRGADPNSDHMQARAVDHLSILSGRDVGESVWTAGTLVCEGVRGSSKDNDSQRRAPCALP